MSDSKLQRLHSELAELQRRKQENKLDYFTPYAKQRDFIAMGTSKRLRCLFGANQCGKSLVGTYELAIHLTGKYPKDWKGKRFKKGIKALAIGETSESTRDILQKYLLGVGSETHGWIPKDSIQRTTTQRGISDAVDYAVIQHTSGSKSMLYFKSYGKGREKLQGLTLDYVLIDEEPPADVFGELLARISATKGSIALTFTPLQGMSEVVQSFLSTDDPSRGHVYLTIDDIDHITPEEKEQIVASYAPHEREARSQGLPMLGSGRIFTTTEAVISFNPSEFEIPNYWPWVGAVDFGIGHPHACVLASWDRESDTLYIVDAWKRSDAGALELSAKMKQWGSSLVWCWPHDGLQRSKDTGESLASVYRNYGLRLHDERVTFEDGTNSLERGVLEMQDAFMTQRLRVAEHLHDWFHEYRIYHRKDGRIVAVNDDLLAATRYAWMGRRFAELNPQGSRSRRPMYRSGQARLDYDPFGDDRSASAHITYTAFPR